MHRIYLDSNATTPIDPEVASAMAPWLGAHFGNPSSVHAHGRQARAALVDARVRIASALGASPEEILFTSGGTEADNLAFVGIARARAGRGPRHVVVSAVEHAAVLEPAEGLEREGFEVTRLAVDALGRVDPGALAGAIRDSTVLVSVMTANNEVGTVQPIADLARIARARGIPFHTDAVQALGKLPVDVDTPPVDALAVSAHKIHGPLGAGVLYLRRGTPILPLARGGGQEGGWRPGTENLPAIVGMARAIELAAERRTRDAPAIDRLARRFLAKLRAEISGVALNGPEEGRLPNTLNLSFEGAEAPALVVSLDLEGVSVSAGSACSSGAIEISHVLGAMGLSEARARSAVRFSLSRDTTWVELDEAASKIARVVARIRSVKRQFPSALTECKFSYRIP